MKYARSSTICLAASLVWAAGCTDDAAEDGTSLGTDTDTDTDDEVGDTTDGTSEDTTTDESTDTTDTTDETTADTTDETTDETTADTTDETTDDTTGETAETDTGMTEDTIFDIQDGTIGEGSDVDVDGVWVTGVAGNAFFAQEPEGGQESGVYVFAGDIDISGLAVGDLVDITGVVAEFNELTEIDASAGTVVEVGVIEPIPAPDLVTTADIQPDVGEPWESVFVRVEGMPLIVDDLPGFDEFTVDDGEGVGYVDNFLYNLIADGGMDFPGFSAGATFTAIQGPLNFTFGNFKLAPRAPEDLEGYMPFVNPIAGVNDLTPGDLVITEIMYDPDHCADANCEYIEVYNATMLEVDLIGLRIQDENFSATGTVNVSVVLAAGEYALLGKGPEMSWTYGVAADAYTGGNPGFNNSGDDLAAILNDNEILDQTAAYVGQGATDNGVSWKLNPDSLDATDNDVAGNWCYSTTDFGDGDLGSPGAANEMACNPNL